MSIDKISVFIITLNEAENLRRLLPMLQGFNEVVIVDSNSTDDTEKTARSFANVKFIKQDWLGFSAQKDFARKACSNEWVLNLDADETFDPSLIEDIITATALDNVAGMTFPCAEILHGYKVPHKLSDHRSKLRFFKRDAGFYPEAMVHEKLFLNGKIVHSDAKIYNWGTSITDILAKQNSYSTLAASERFAKGRSSNIFKLVFRFPVAFIKYYVLKRHFLNGAEGFIAAINYAHYTFLKEAKLYLLTRNIASNIKKREQ